MAHQCETCGETFQTLTKKRLHDCSGAPVEMHDVSSLTDDLPARFLTVDEAAALDEGGVQRFFPILSIGGITPSGEVIAGYAKTTEGHFLLAFNGEEETWYVLEQNTREAEFDHKEKDLLMYVCQRSDVDPADVYGYDSNDPDYPLLGA